jgi:hypothetical protein
MKLRKLQWHEIEALLLLLTWLSAVILAGLLIYWSRSIVDMVSYWVEK